MFTEKSPVGFRLGIVKGWPSNWYEKVNPAAVLYEDYQLRKHVYARLVMEGCKYSH